MKMKSILILIVTLILTMPLHAQLRKANKQFELYRFSKAIPLYQKAADHPREQVRAEASARLADSYRLTGDVMQSVIWYREAVKYSQNEPANYFYLGQALMSAGQYVEARDAFLQYAELKPDDPRGTMFADHCLLLPEWDNKTQLAEIKNVTAINSEYSDFSPVYYRNGIVFTTDRIQDEKKSNRFEWTERSYTTLMYAEPRFYNDFWNEFREPTAVPGYKDMEYHDGPAFFINDQKEIYVTRTTTERVKRKKNKYRTHNLKIYSTRVGSTDKNAFEPFFLNSDAYSVAHPTLSEDGTLIVFASDMPGGYGGMDLYYCFQEDNKWSDPVNLGPEINTIGNELFPYLHDDGQLYFASDGLPGYGGLDLFVSSQSDDGSWSAPENMYKPFNSSYDDFGIVFNEDKSGGFFSSSRPGAKGVDDIFAFKMHEPIEIETPMISGYVKDKQTLIPIENSTVFLLNTDQSKAIILKSNSDGYFESEIEKGIEYLVKAVKQDYIQDCLSFKIASEETRTEFDTPRDLLLDKLEVDKVFRIDNIYYDFDKWEIRPDAAVELNKLVKIMEEHPISIELSSHTDSRGSDAYNLRLSQRRAESAMTYLISQGIAHGRIMPRGYGETRLTNHCFNGIPCSPEEHQANRRTEFKVLGFDRNIRAETYDYSTFNEGDEIFLALLPVGFFSSCLEIQPIEEPSKPRIIQEHSSDGKDKTKETLLRDQKVNIKEPPSDEVCFGVQILATSRAIDLNDPIWKNISHLERFYDGSLYRYVVGCEKDISSAHTIRRTLRTQGYPDSFTVKIEKGAISPAY